MLLTDLNLGGCKQVRDLTPLQGMPLTRLNLDGCPLRDLTPLKGMPLTTLYLSGCFQVSDLTPLHGMPLTKLDLSGCDQVRDLTPLEAMNLTEVLFTPKNITKGIGVLRQMKSLNSIGLNGGNKWRPTEFWKKYDAGEFK